MVCCSDSHAARVAESDDTRLPNETRTPEVSSVSGLAEVGDGFSANAMQSPADGSGPSPQFVIDTSACPRESLGIFPMRETALLTLLRPLLTDFLKLFHELERFSTCVCVSVVECESHGSGATAPLREQRGEMGDSGVDGRRMRRRTADDHGT